jgi:hypothetical protein
MPNKRMSIKHRCYTDDYLITVAAISSTSGDAGELKPIIIKPNAASKRTYKAKPGNQKLGCHGGWSRMYVY